MVVNGGNMVKKLRREIHALEHIIAALLHRDVQLENRYFFFRVKYKFSSLIFVGLSFTQTKILIFNFVFNINSYY